MKILVTGGTGFFGGALVRYLTSQGHECWVVTRDPQRAARTGIPTTFLSLNDPAPAVDAVINLAGESVVGLWTSRKKSAILESRVNITRRMIDWIGRMQPAPRVFISASAIGYYGHRPGETLTEESPADPREAFRFNVCQQWENAARGAETLGVRTIFLRLSQILHPSGGFMAPLLPLYRWGACVGFGDASAHFSWISLDDALHLVEWLMTKETIRGPVNAAAPAHARSGDFRDALAHALGRKPLGSLPGALLKGILGDFSAALIEDQEVWPRKALDGGFVFRHDDLARYLESLRLKES